MSSNLNTAHSNMLSQQVRANDVQDQAIINVLATTDRAQFVDTTFNELAYADTQLPIGCGQVMMSPTQEGRLLDALAVQENETVLEIGTGTGYFTALLAQLAQQVISVEIFEELHQQAQLNCAAFSNIDFHCMDATKSLPMEERVDVIFVSSAVPDVPELLLHQIKVGGRMLVIQGKAPIMQVQRITRNDEREWSTDILFETAITDLVNAEAKPEFTF